MNKTKLIIIGIVVVLTALVALQNTEPVHTSILFFSITMPRVVLLLLTLLIGFAAGVFTMMHYSVKQKPAEQPHDG